MDVDSETPVKKEQGQAGTTPYGLQPDEWTFYQFVQTSGKGVKLTDRPPSMSIENAYMAMNSLLKKNALEMMQQNGENLLRAVDLKEAEKASKLNEEGRLVYNTIRAAGNEGIWSKDLKKKTNLHAIVLQRTIKLLEQRQEIKAVKHVKYPTRKIYMLFNLQPSSEVTGGAWYTDQELDTEFIDSLKTACLKYISARSFPRNEDVRDAVFSAEHEHYPTAKEIRRFITESRISSVELSVKDITSLLDILVYDGLVEKKLPYVSGFDEDFSDDEGGAGVGDEDAALQWGYKAVRKASGRLPTSAFTEVPCGKCPVFSFCHENGPVNPFNCEYFKTWLSW
ncbi:RNA polymerase Rpc34 [Syncephalastrum racemosum]|uniref:DNA-directed RNA polymerase III subunit RPC6 n=1 Tax=Syncephalastrum racemosum TaxID=13706 RepID=A0A1X2H6Q9_SYNRA|nr:RNA polymerase Rpc34 [Syncephalastrum racemosum]